MKILRTTFTPFFAICLFSFLIRGIDQSFADVSSDPPGQKEIVYEVINIEDVFVPKGFDETSDVYVVVHGNFPSGCYSWRDVLLEHKANKIHEIESLATVVEGACTLALVPFTEQVELGKFEEGTHTLIFINADGTSIEKPLIIE